MNTDRPSLLATLMTPRGRGAVATIAIHGDHALVDREIGAIFRAANGRPISQQALGRIVFGKWGSEAAEDVVLCRIDAENLEIHCHGGETAAKRILEDWRKVRTEVIAWDAMIHVTTDLLDAELQTCLSRAATWRAAERLLQQADGRLQTAFESLQQRDWSVSGRKTAQATINDLLRWSEWGLHLTQPWKVVLTGRPNVGKSSLINALLGYARSIVFDQPGTTRDVVTAVTAFDGWPVELSDTAGLRDEAENLEAAGIERARKQMVDADLVVVVDDGETRNEGEAWEILKEQAFSLHLRRSPLLVANKSDVAGKWGSGVPASVQRVSAKTGAGVDKLQRAIMQQLVPKVPPDEIASPVTERQVECLRTALGAIEQNDPAQFQLAVAALCGG